MTAATTIEFATGVKVVVVLVAVVAAAVNSLHRLNLVPTWLMGRQLASHNIQFNSNTTEMAQTRTEMRALRKWTASGSLSRQSVGVQVDVVAPHKGHRKALFLFTYVSDARRIKLDNEIEKPHAKKIFKKK